LAEEVIEQEVMFYPTKFFFPLWARRRAILAKGALERLRISDLSVEHVKPEFELPVGILRPFLNPRLPPTLNPSVYVEHFTAEAPVDGAEIVEWMHYSGPDKYILSARQLEYNRLGSELVSDSGDPYIPGVAVEDIAFLGEKGDTVNAKGYGTAMTPLGNFRIPSLKKGYGIWRDLITAGSMTYLGSIQWGANLLKWKELARTPIETPVGFFMDTRGNVLSNFFEQLPPRPKFRIRVLQSFLSSVEQTLILNFRDPTDFSKIMTSTSVDIPAGVSEVSFIIVSFPYVPPMVVEIAPSDGVETSLIKYLVR